MDERRSEARVPLRAEAEVRFTSWAVFQLIWTVNISQGGMSLEVVAAAPPKIGDRLTVRLQLPKGDPIELEAEVRHAADATLKKAGAEQKFQVGVKFVGIDEAKKKSIEDLLRAQGLGGGKVGLTRKQTG